MSTSNTRDLILTRTNRGLTVFRHYIRGGWKKNQPFYNPLYNDTEPACRVHLDSDGRYRLHDFGSEEHSGDCFFFVGALNGLDSNKPDDFKQILRIIDRDLALGCFNEQYAVKPTHVARTKKSEVSKVVATTDIDNEDEQGSVDPKPKPKREYTIKQREFSSYDLDFWGVYGITIAILQRFNVVALDEFISLVEGCAPKRYYYSLGTPMYGYLQRSYVKIYRPNSSIRFMFGGEKDENYCFGLEQLPKRGDVLYITGGEKDVMTLSARGFNAISFNGENNKIPHDIIRKLSFMFKHIVLLYDTDSTGISSSSKHQKELSEFGVLRVVLPLPGTKEAKDISDYFKLGGSVASFKSLFLNILNSIYSNTISILNSCVVNFKSPPPQSENIVSVNSVPLGAAGNLLCITGGEGTGKSNFVGALIAGAVHCNDSIVIDTLGLSVAQNINSKAVVLYDTEQSEAQLFKNCVNIIKRAGLRSLPDQFKAYSLTSMSRSMRLHSIVESMDHLHHIYNGIHMVVIDGVADLIRGANDEKESIEIVEELYRLAGIYNTCIVCVLHFIPNGLKLRGHLGSELQRKSAAIISIEKDGHGDMSVIKAIKVRDGSPLDVPMIQFAWSKERKMHCYVGEKSAEERRERKEVELKRIAELIFRDQPSVTYTELQRALMHHLGIMERAAKSNIKYMRERGIIVDVTNGGGSEPSRLRLGSH